MLEDGWNGEAGQRLAKAMAASDLSRVAVAAICDLSVQAVGNWINAKNAPTIENIIRIGSRTSISLDYVLLGHNDVFRTMDGMEPETLAAASGHAMNLFKELKLSPVYLEDVAAASILAAYLDEADRKRGRACGRLRQLKMQLIGGDDGQAGPTEGAD